MTLKAPFKEGTDFEPMPEGNYPARCIALIHIGTNTFEYLGEVKKSNKIRLTFEFPTEKKVFKEENGEQPYVLSIEYTLSLHEKSKLRPIIDNWLGKKMTDSEAMDFDVESLVGREALVNVIHENSKKTGNPYATIASISQVPKGMKVEAQINPSKILNYNDKWSEDLFNSLPDFIRSKMETSDEYVYMRQLQDKNAVETKSDGKLDHASDEDPLADLPF